MPSRLRIFFVPQPWRRAGRSPCPAAAPTCLTAASSSSASPCSPPTGPPLLVPKSCNRRCSPQPCGRRCSPPPEAPPRAALPVPRPPLAARLCITASPYSHAPTTQSSSTPFTPCAARNDDKSHTLLCSGAVLHLYRHMSSDPRNPNPPPPGSSSSAAPAGASYFPLPFHLQQQQPVVPTYQYQQLQQAQQLFQRDAQTITPQALESVKAALATSDVLDPFAARANASSSDAASKKKAIPRRAAGQSWEDPTLTEWPENDFRLFCGDLGNEVNDDVLSKAFSRFPSFNMAKVVRDKRTGKTKGYGFVSFSNPTDLAGAIKEMNGKYVGNRPIKLRKSNWKERTDVEALQRQKNHIQKKPKTAKKGILHK